MRTWNGEGGLAKYPYYYISLIYRSKMVHKGGGGQKCLKMPPIGTKEPTQMKKVGGRGVSWFGCEHYNIMDVIV